MATVAFNPDPRAQRDKIVSMIYQKRRILFSGKADMQTKNWAWEEITAEAQKVGLFPIERDFIYLRDTRWQNWRKRVIHKYKRNGKKSPGFDTADKLVFEIVQEYFPNILQKAEKQLLFDDSDDTAMDDRSDINGVEYCDFDDPIKVVNDVNEGDAFDSAESDPEHDEAMEASIVKKELDGKDGNVAGVQNNGATSSSASKADTMEALSLEMLKMQNYKMKLELIKMERELYLKPSKYTKEIIARQDQRL